MFYNCPFCHHNNALLYREEQETRSGEIKDIHKCKECGLLYPYPRMDELESKAYIYSLNLNQNLSQFDNPTRPTSSRYYLTKFLKKYVDPSGNALDIGAAEGRFCFILESMGFIAYGIELQKSMADIAKENGLKVFSGMFPDNIPDELLQRKYNLISVLETIYYFVNLKKSLQTIYEMLTREGFLLIQCHQAGSRYYHNNSYFRRYGDDVQGIPSPDTLSYCLIRSGFEIVKIIGAPSSSLPFNLDRIRPDIFRKVFSKIYHLTMLEYTLWDLKKADRILLLAKKIRK